MVATLSLTLQNTFASFSAPSLEVKKVDPPKAKPSPRTALPTVDSDEADELCSLLSTTDASGDFDLLELGNVTGVIGGESGMTMVHSRSSCAGAFIAPVGSSVRPRILTLSTSKTAHARGGLISPPCPCERPRSPPLSHSKIAQAGYSVSPPCPRERGSFAPPRFLEGFF